MQRSRVWQAHHRLSRPATNPGPLVARASRVENRARALCIELARVTDSWPMQYRMAQTIAKAVGQDEATADMAIAYAVERDWLIAAGTQILKKLCGA